MGCCSNQPATIGELRHAIEIQARFEQEDIYGGASAPVWGERYKLRAKMEYKNGSEQGEKYGRISAMRGWHFIMRYAPGVVTTDRILFDDLAGNVRTFNIRAVQNVEERGQWLRIVAEEGTVD